VAESEPVTEAEREAEREPGDGDEVEPATEAVDEDGAERKPGAGAEDGAEDGGPVFILPGWGRPGAVSLPRRPRQTTCRHSA